MGDNHTGWIYVPDIVFVGAADCIGWVADITNLQANVNLHQSIASSLGIVEFYVLGVDLKVSSFKEISGQGMGEGDLVEVGIG